MLLKLSLKGVFYAYMEWFLLTCEERQMSSLFFLCWIGPKEEWKRKDGEDFSSASKKRFAHFGITEWYTQDKLCGRVCWFSPMVLLIDPWYCQSTRVHEGETSIRRIEHTNGVPQGPSIPINRLSYNSSPVIAEKDYNNNNMAVLKL